MLFVGSEKAWFLEAGKLFPFVVVVVVVVVVVHIFFSALFLFHHPFEPKD